jgi:hypothetical protein
MDSARRRLQVTRYAVGIVAAGVFAGGVAIARAAHPGSHRHSASGVAAIPNESSAVAAAANSSVFGGSSDGSGTGSSVSPAPAASPPVVQSSGS